MNYTELKTNVQDICEVTFTDAQLALFTEQAEQKIYNTVQIPALRKNVSGVMTSSNEYLSTPSDFLYVYSLAVVDGSGNFTFLLNKDVNFIREAYPSSSSTGTPKHYALFDNDTILLGPTPNSGFTTQLHYGYYPQSIVVAGTTWLGEEFDSALLNGTLVEAIRFMKGEPDMIALYEKMYASAVALLKILGDGKLRSDTYRSGQARLEVG
jgi:hypothetical protein